MVAVYPFELVHRAQRDGPVRPAIARRRWCFVRSRHNPAGQREPHGDPLRFLPPAASGQDAQPGASLALRRRITIVETRRSERLRWGRRIDLPWSGVTAMTRCLLVDPGMDGRCYNLLRHMGIPIPTDSLYACARANCSTMHTSLRSGNHRRRGTPVAVCPAGASMCAEINEPGYSAFDLSVRHLGLPAESQGGPHGLRTGNGRIQSES